jgi:hypothetical protein
MVSMSKKPYPQNDDIVNAILKVLSKAYTMTPDEFPEAVKKATRRRGLLHGPGNHEEDLATL